MIAASVRLLRPRAEQAGVELGVDVPSDLPLLYGILLGSGVWEAKVHDGGGGNSCAVHQ